jgi:hypothetical protein
LNLSFGFLFFCYYHSPLIDNLSTLTGYGPTHNSLILQNLLVSCQFHLVFEILYFVMANFDHQSQWLSKFDGSNYTRWAARMKIILEANNLWHGVIVEEDTKSIVKEESTIGKVMSFVMRNIEALNKIQMTLQDDQFDFVSHLGSSNEIWDHLEKIFMSKSASNRIHIGNLFAILKKESNESYEAYLTRARALAYQLKSIGDPRSEVQVIAQILRGLSQKNKGLIEALTAFPDDILSLDYLESRFHYLEIQIIKSQENHGSALVTISKQLSEKKYFKGKKRGICNYCKKEGHWKNECRALKKKLESQRNYNDKSKEKANDVSEEKKTHHVAQMTLEKIEKMVVLNATQKKGREEISWYIDS